MELHDSISIGLRLLENMGLSSTNSMFKFLEEDICSYITYSNSTNQTNVSQLCRVKGDNVKGAYASLLSLITESARHDVRLEDLLNLLQNLNICLSRNDNFNEMYKTTKPKCQALLNHIGSHPPHILDATWTLDFCVKANSSEKINTLFYLVQLHTEAYDPDETSRYVRFICTLEDLQDLILKLREMFKQIERISNL